MSFEDLTRQLSECRTIVKAHDQSFNVRRKRILGTYFTIYTRDWFNTLVNAPLYRSITIFFLVYVACISFFAAGYVYDACTDDLTSFREAYLFSVATQATIGYGNYVPSSKCNLSMALVTVQSFTSLLFDALCMGMLFQKFARATRRTIGLIFSHNVCICVRNGKPCLTIRVADLRKSQVIECHITVYLCHWKTTMEGERDYVYTPIEVSPCVNLCLATPLIVEHQLNERSPLSISMKELAKPDAELLIIVEGISDVTSNTLQARHSYSVSDVLWDHQFTNIIDRDLTGMRRVDFKRFHNTVPQTRTNTEPLKPQSVPFPTSSCRQHSALLTPPFIPHETTNNSDLRESRDRRSSLPNTVGERSALLVN